MREGDKYHSSSPFKELKELADNDWETFCKRIGEETLINAAICSMIERGWTMGRIAIRYSITKRKVQYIVESKCRCKIPT